MRYQDWDVILYPKGCQVPFKEFKTTCYAVQAGSGSGSAGSNGAAPTPLLTCFVPGIPGGRHFSISLHSWTQPVHVGLLAMPGLGDRALWRVKIVVDGLTTATQLYPHDCSWPQVVSEGTSVEPGGHTVIHDLKWPNFYQTSITQRDWDAADATGRIKVEVSAGFREQIDGKSGFTALSTSVCFAFFPAPIGHLERVGIAWPNPKMFDNPLLTDNQMNKYGLSGVSSGLHSITHRRNYSNDSTTKSSPMRGLPIPPPPTPVMSSYNYALQAGSPQMMYDSSHHGPHMTEFVSGRELTDAFGSLALPSVNESLRQQKTQVEIRLPSDQLQNLILAMGSPKQQETMSMPPPPLPLHALAAKGGTSTHPVQPGSKFQQTVASDSIAGLHSASRDSSDVSMHTACNYFPVCTSEDDSSMVVHNSPACPTTVVKSRKEGSSPTKPRDFMSTILGPQEQVLSPPADEMKSSSISSSSPMETPRRKRTRSALKAISLNDGFLEKKEPSARKPLRKVSRVSSGGAKKTKEVVVAGSGSGSQGKIVVAAEDDEDKENQMVVDA